MFRAICGDAFVSFVLITCITVCVTCLAFETPWKLYMTHVVIWFSPCIYFYITCLIYHKQTAQFHYCHSYMGPRIKWNLALPDVDESNYWFRVIIAIESIKTTSMEDVSTGVLAKNKEYTRSKDKAKKYMIYQNMYNCICQNKKNKLSIMTYLQPNCCLKIDFQKVDQHAGGKWLIHDNKRRKDNQLQSLKLPANYPSWVARCDIKGVRWHHVESDILKDDPGTKTSGEVRNCRTPNT